MINRFNLLWSRANLGQYCFKNWFSKASEVVIPEVTDVFRFLQSCYFFLKLFQSWIFLLSYFNLTLFCQIKILVYRYHSDWCSKISLSTYFYPNCSRKHLQLNFLHLTYWAQYHLKPSVCWWLEASYWVLSKDLRL